MEKDEIDELLRAPDRATEHGQRDYALAFVSLQLGRTSHRGRASLDRGSDLGRNGHWLGEDPWKRPEDSVLPTLEKDDG